MGNPTMEITTGIGCRIDCRHCPQSRLVARYRVRSGVMKMTFDLFRECLAKIPPDVEIHFSGMSEPWLNGECTRMLLHAAAENRRIAVYTTLQGMTDPDFDAMREVGYQYFTIHVPDAHGNSRIPVDEGYLRFLDRVVRYPLNVAIERQFSCHGALHPAVRAIVEGSGFRLYDSMIDRAGNLENSGAGPTAHRGRITCERAGDRLNRNVLLPDGTVLLCCMDYNMDHVLGNLHLQGYADLFEGKVHRSVSMSLEPENPPSLCRKCSVAVGIEGREADLAGRVETLFLSGETTGAMQLAADVAKRYPDNATNWNNIGVILNSLGRTGDAMDCFRAALSRDPGHPDALNNLREMEDPA